MKRWLRAPVVLRMAGRAMGGYLRLLERTTRFVGDPPDYVARARAEAPFIAALWHGQHFHTPLVCPRDLPLAVMISRHGDGAINAHAAALFGVRVIRGSGAQRRDQIAKRGGAQALRQAIDALEGGEIVAMTADVPKVSRVAGRGIVTLARLSGRPILPLAVVLRRRIDINSWDRSSIGLPFGRGAVVLGDPITVPRDADPDACEAARRAVEEGLDAVHARAYGLVGCRDHGAGRASVAEARARACALAGGDP